MYNMMNIVVNAVLYKWNLLREYNFKILPQKQKNKTKKQQRNPTTMRGDRYIGGVTLSQCICLANHHFYILDNLKFYLSVIPQ